MDTLSSVLNAQSVHPTSLPAPLASRPCLALWHSAPQSLSSVRCGGSTRASPQLIPTACSLLPMPPFQGCTLQICRASSPPCPQLFLCLQPLSPLPLPPALASCPCLLPLPSALAFCLLPLASCLLLLAICCPLLPLFPLPLPRCLAPWTSPNPRPPRWPAMRGARRHSSCSAFARVRLPTRGTRPYTPCSSVIERAQAWSQGSAAPSTAASSTPSSSTASSPSASQWSSR